MSYYENLSGSFGRSSGPGYPESVMPGLRPDLVIRRQAHGNEVYFIIKDPRVQQYYRYLPDEWDIISGFDGTKTAEAIVDGYNRAHPSDPIDEETIRSYRQALKEMDLLALPAVETSLQFVERMREQRRNRAESSKFKNIFEMTFSAWDPDEAFNRVTPYLRFLYTKPFFIVSLCAILMMAFVSAVKWDEFKQGTIDLYTFTDKSFWDILVFIFLMTVTGTLHELGHGLTLKHFGGEVRQVGFLLFYLTPAFYCDVSDSYLLTSRKERLWVTFAGVYCELILCSLATFVWYFAVPGTLLYDLVFKIILFTGISSFLINMNPLIKLDGYYAVMDSLEVPELREESFQYIGLKIKRLFRLKADDMEGLTRRKRRIFLIYGSLAILYTAVLYLVIVLWLRNIFLRSFQGLGYFLLLGAVYFIFGNELRGLFRFLRFFYLDKKEVLMKRKTLVTAGASFAILLLLATVIQTHTKISSRCTVEPVQVAEVRPEVEGFVREVRVEMNDAVRAGQELVRMENPDLAREVSKTSTDLELLDRRLSILQSENSVSDYQMKLREKSELSDRKSELDRKIGLLALKSPISGNVATPHLEETRGRYLKKGTIFCKVEDVARVKIEIPFREYYVEDVKPGQKVELRLEAYPTHTFEGEVARVSPATRERIKALEGAYSEFVATAVVDNSDGRLIPGMRGDAKILAQKYSVTGRILRELRRWFQSRIW